MFCAACGSAINDKLNYCKNCGAKIAKEEEETPSSMMNNLLTSVTFVALGGLGILVGLSTVLLKNGFDHKGIMVIAALYLFALSGICYMLLSQLPKLIDAKLNRKPAEPPAAETYQPPQLFAKTTAQLEEQREPIMSVTDHTTRTFDKVPRT
ncbi:MAG TPA: hypothetical protein VIL74_18025 [Pyrinomonadaceae bacterium]|jgi:hypothetical protein